MTTPTRPAYGDQDVLEELGKALCVTPSPEFLARVRAQVREAAASAPAAIAWWPRVAVLATAAVALVVAVAIWPGRTSSPRPGDIRTNHASGAVATRPPQTRAGPDERARPLMPIAPSTRAMRAHRPAGSASTQAASTAEPPREVLVPDDQRRALDRLLIAIREGRAAVPAPRRVLEDEQGQMLQPAPIEMLPGAAVERTGSKDR